MYRYQLGLDAQIHDNFVSSHPQASLLQSSNWANIKDSWKNERIGFYHNDSLVAAASVLIQPLPLGFSMIYIPRGPIMDYSNEELVAYVITSLKSYAKTQRALFIKFDPNLHLKQFDSKHIDQKDHQFTLDAITTLKNQSCQWLGRTTNMSNNVQPRFQANVYQDNFDFDKLPKKTKQEIRTARNKGVQLKFGGIELVPIFAELMKKTEERKHINLRNLNYFKKLLETYADHSYITLAYLDLETRLATINVEREKFESEKSRFTEKTKTTKIAENDAALKRLTEESQLLSSLILSGTKELPLAATLSINFGPTSELLYAGMDNTYRQYQAPTLTWYETMTHAFELGITSQNMGGIEATLDGGLYHFKSKFNPKIEEFIGEFDIPVVHDLFYKAIVGLYNIRKSLRNRK